MGKQYLLMWHRTDQWEEEKSVDICGNFVSSLASGFIWQQYKDVLFCLVTTVRPVDCVRMFSISKVPLDQDDCGEWCGGVWTWEEGDCWYLGHRCRLSWPDVSQGNRQFLCSLALTAIEWVHIKNINYFGFWHHLIASQQFSNDFWFRKFPIATAGGWNDFLGVGRSPGDWRGEEGSQCCHITGKWNPTWGTHHTHHQSNVSVPVSALPPIFRRFIS